MNSLNNQITLFYENVGVTGSRRGMTGDQRAGFRDFIEKYKPSYLTHGCCVGADEEAVAITHKFSPSTIIVARPGLYASGRHNSDHSSLAQHYSGTSWSPETMFKRNRTICQNAQILCVFPRREIDTLAALSDPYAEGGTAFTFQYMTKRLRKPAIVFFADGDVHRVE